ncbi:glycosyltransferase family 2 protein [Chloroflexia bacterium SDU3-3]|nr:glycosyltransferase family 2 protein [Chloroflexia bacterium SDU3-3]
MSELVSLVAVAYNSADLLPSFLDALASSGDTGFELVVVDNASTDGTLALLESAAGRLPFALRAVEAGANLGFGRACNLGAAHAGGELLVFMNPDVRVLPGWLAGLRASSARFPDALICPTTLAPEEQRQPTPALQQVAAIPGAAMLVRRAVWRELGGFDEHFFMYWEDTELCWRAWLLGFQVLADLGTFVRHQRGGSAGGSRWDAERARNSLRTYLKLMRWRRALPFALLLAAKTAVKFARWRDPALLDAWRWNARHLGATLAERRALARRRRGDPALLERRAATLERRLRAERAARRRAGA